MEQKAFLTVGEVAAIIGIGRTKTYELVATGQIPSVYIAGSRSRRIPRVALDKWITKQASQAGPQEEA